ncbi:DNA-directed RNA polymerase II subunit RPB3 [Bonamia ostreae]|uniref:DNA-directed RNA polymerase II subunit RPB3 n=1 Tax=Bonamia ostreae TaxID=126728 RepID=A0ABV2AMX3_9EUKA
MDTPSKYPKIKILELNSSSIRFKMFETNHSIANGLRRILISEIPCLAFDSAEINENTSFLSDEMIAHRLGLVPLQCDNIEEFNIPEQCSCEGACPKCQVCFKLRVRAQRDKLLVYSGDIKNESKREQPGHSVKIFDADAPKGEGTILAKLGPNQKLEIVLVARRGIGKEHSKWSPAFVKFNYEGGEGNDSGENAPTEFEMEVESMGQMAPEKLVRTALKVLREKIDTAHEKFTSMHDLFDDT